MKSVGKIASLSVLFGLAVSLSGCAASKPSCGDCRMSCDKESKFVHGVFFNVKPGTSDEAIDAQIADAEALLGTIPSVRCIQSGQRDVRMQRDVNDQDYTIGLLVVFDDKDGHDLYNTHETHLAYVAKHKANWASVRVFDFLSE
jgi:hypothetical protein